MFVGLWRVSFRLRAGSIETPEIEGSATGFRGGIFEYLEEIRVKIWRNKVEVYKTIIKAYKF